ncbi:MAG: UDP-N-acetylmuramate dehydrogenase [Desulfomicrobium sp.]|nr:UDP-N-acetylmuramate dehydrogenase [Desulfomicrobium sp.]
MKHLHHISLKDHCTFRIGGIAKDFFLPQNMEEMVDLIRQHRKQRRPFWILGGGANTLFPDEEITISIISTKEMNNYHHDGQTIYAESGMVLDTWVLNTIRQDLQGTECLSGIPGTLGGALFMNAGAYGQEISDHLVSVTVLTKDNEILKIPKNQCGFSYRMASHIQKTIILAGSWQLPKGDAVLLLAKRKEILTQRRKKQPLDYPSAGSVFKRPPGAYASQLIDQAGLKGTRIGGAQVSEKHAGFIINTGNATCQDVLELIELCRQTVREHFGHELELEQRLCPACPNT